MASHTSLRQASRIVQSNKSYLAVSRIRQSSQSFNSHTLLSARTTSFSRSPLTNRHHVVQQSRNLSWWGSSASSSPSIPAPEAHTSNLNISEPSDLRNIISPDRAFKASPDVSSAELHSDTPSNPNSLEPQFIQDIQQAIAEPHLSDPVDLPLHPEEIPERLGYLKEVCGLDFGWGPTSTVQWVLEHLHIDGGLSWTAAIVVTAIVVRGMIFPFLIGAAKETQKMRDMKDVITPIQEEYKAAKAKLDQQKMLLAANRLIAVRKEFQSKPLRAFLPPLLQIPFGFGCWRLLRNAAEVPVPGFVTESWLWTSDLTFSDPFYVVPLLSGALIYFTIGTNARVNGTAQNQSLMVILKYVLPCVTVVFMSFQPGAVQLYFLTSSLVGLVSARILQVSSIRRYFDMPALAPRIPIAPISPTTGSSAVGPRTSTAPATTVGGLHRRSFTERAVEAERAAKAAAEQAERDAQISKVDVSVDKVKQLWGKATKTVKGMGQESGMAEKWKSGKEGKMKQSQEAKAEEYEARMRQMLDEKRRARNARGGGRM